MTKIKDDGGNAFPASEDSIALGLTTLDYFAAQVATGLATSNKHDPWDVAAIAYDIAEDMVAERQARFEARQKAWKEYLQQSKPMAAHNDLNSVKNKV